MFSKIQGFDERVLTDDIPVLLCGDMNSGQDSSLFAFMDGRPIKPNRKVKKANHYLYDVVTEEVNKTKMMLQGKFNSSYARYPHESETRNKTTHKFPDFTVYSNDNKKVIDHIFYTKKDFEVISLLTMPNQEDVADLLPNRHYPSDHLRIEAVLQFK